MKRVFTFVYILYLCFIHPKLFSQSRIAIINPENKDSLQLKNEIETQSIEDSSLSESNNFNIAILAIKGWQKISFKTSLLNCQFEPCCSNYGIHSIKEKGVLEGILYSADRISRCHPFAYKYYTYDKGRLNNNLQSEPEFKSRNFPYLSIPLSFFIPGFNKMVNGRFYDGLSMFIITELSAYNTYKTYRNRKKMFVPFLFVTSSFYISDIYFNILSLRR